MNHYTGKQQYEYSSHLSGKPFKDKAHGSASFISEYERDHLALIEKRKEIERKLNEGLYNYPNKEHKNYSNSSLDWNHHSSDHRSLNIIDNVFVFFTSITFTLFTCFIFFYLIYFIFFRNIQHDSDERNKTHEQRKRIKVEDEFRSNTNSQKFDLRTNDIDQRSYHLDIRNDLTFSPFRTSYSQEARSPERASSPTNHIQKRSHHHQPLPKAEDQDMRNENANGYQSRSDFEEEKNRKERIQMERERIQNKLKESEKRMASSISQFDIVGNIIQEQQSRTVTMAGLGDSGKRIKEKLVSDKILPTSNKQDEFNTQMVNDYGQSKYDQFTSISPTSNLSQNQEISYILQQISDNEPINLSVLSSLVWFFYYFKSKHKLKLKCKKKSDLLTTTFVLFFRNLIQLVATKKLRLLKRLLNCLVTLCLDMS